MVVNDAVPFDERRLLEQRQREPGEDTSAHQNDGLAGSPGFVSSSMPSSAT